MACLSATWPQFQSPPFRPSNFEPSSFRIWFNKKKIKHEKKKIRKRSIVVSRPDLVSPVLSRVPAARRRYSLRVAWYLQHELFFFSFFIRDYVRLASMGLRE